MDTVLYLAFRALRGRGHIPLPHPPLGSQSGPLVSNNSSMFPLKNFSPDKSLYADTCRYEQGPETAMTCRSYRPYVIDL